MTSMGCSDVEVLTRGVEAAGRPGGQLKEATEHSRFRRAAEEIAAAIRDHARRARDGNLYWCHPGEPIAGLRPTPLGAHLFSGSLGVALFLATYSWIAEDEDFGSLALKSLVPLRREIHELVGDPEKARGLRHSIGGLSGIGSLVYGLVRIGEALGDSSVVDDGQAAATLLNADRIAADDKLDVMSGSAGAILALLALDRRRPGKTLNGLTPLEMAVLCADHLMGSRARYQGFEPVWLYSDEPGPVGFCHGTAGIATALVRLGTRIGDPRLLDAAERSLAYERSLFVPSAGNWQTSAGATRLNNSWCKGAPGLALSRISMLGLLDDPLLATELCVALATTGEPNLSTADDLCCGNCGRVDVLLQAARTLGDPDALASASLLAAGMLARARGNGFYSMIFRGEVILDLRFFSGLAGIGYTMLRLLATDRIECVPAME